MKASLFNELCADCQAKMVEMGQEPEDEGDEMGVDGEGEPSKSPLESFDDAEDRGMMRIMVGLGKGAGKGKMKQKIKAKE